MTGPSRTAVCQNKAGWPPQAVDFRHPPRQRRPAIGLASAGTISSYRPLRGQPERAAQARAPTDGRASVVIETCSAWVVEKQSAPYAASERYLARLPATDSFISEHVAENGAAQ